MASSPTADGRAVSAVGQPFLSHATPDKPHVEDLRKALALHDVHLWVDAHEMAPSATLPAEIRAAIERAPAFVVLLTEDALRSTWVADEIALARTVAGARPDYRVLLIVAEPLDINVLRFLFGAEHEPLGIPVRLSPGWVDEVVPRILTGLGRQLPRVAVPIDEPDIAPLAELRIELEDPDFDETGGKRRATARARVHFAPTDGSPAAYTAPFRFVAPLGPIEDGELRWYLERYVRWPYGAFRDRARAVEDQLPVWGRDLLDAITRTNPALELVHRFRATSGDRRISVRVDDQIVDTAPEPVARAREAATTLLSLPWELLHDEAGYLFQGAHGARVRRRLPNGAPKDPVVTQPPLRILLVSARPEDDRVAFIDHRASARPVVEAVAELGDLARLTILEPPTFAALTAELARAAATDEPYHVVHFDGHGVYDRAVGLGALCFEHEEDATKIDQRRSRIVQGNELSKSLRDHRVPLFILDARQSVKSDARIEANVAGQLLQGGVASVVAMSHSVLVETARRFVTVFYRSLCQGDRVGTAMLAAQRALATDPARGAAPGAADDGPLTLQDWFVPVLYQEDADPQLVHSLPSEQAQKGIAHRWEVRLGDIPAARPRHNFIERSRELLSAERTLAQGRYVVLRGDGGEGKTTLALELAAWLVATRRVDRAVFIPLDKLPLADVRDARNHVNLQLRSDFARRAAGDDERAQQVLERALAEEDVVLVVDNLETVLPSSGDGDADLVEPERADTLPAWLARLAAIGRTRIVLTTREAVPAPFDEHEVRIGRLDPQQASELVASVLRHAGLAPALTAASTTIEEIDRALSTLIETARGHARSLVLLAPEVARAGLDRTAVDLAAIMATLEARYPGDRERSLLASVELSVRRLPAAMRARIAPLAAFHGGGHVDVIADALDVSHEEAVALAVRLVNIGLGAPMPYGYLRLDPALGPALAATLDDAGRAAARLRWRAATLRWADFLRDQRRSDAQIAAAMTSLDLGNLLALLFQSVGPGDATEAVRIALVLERLIEPLGRTAALHRVGEARRRAAALLGGDASRESLKAAHAAVEEQRRQGRTAEAVRLARSLLARTEAAGPDAYDGAALDLAECHFLLGETIFDEGNSEDALVALREAQARLATIDTDAAATMAIGVVKRIGDCLRTLGQLQAAAAAYEDVVQRCTERGDQRNVAAARSQLAAVLLAEGRLEEAIAEHVKARDTFVALREPLEAATISARLAQAYRRTERYDDAERTLQEVLSIRVRHGDLSGQGRTLGALGLLYGAQERHEDAVRFHRDAASVFANLADVAQEGIVRHNAARDLLALGRRAEARREVLRAIKCISALGHASAPWLSCGLLHDIEVADGNAVAAAAARSQARSAYLAFRRDGGQTTLEGGRLAGLVAGVLAVGDPAGTAAKLAARAHAIDRSSMLAGMLSALAAILAGSRDPALAEDPSLEFRDAVEIQLLLEHAAVVDAQRADGG